MANIIDILIRAQDQASDQIRKIEAASGKLGDSLAPVTTAMKVAGVATVALGAASIKMAGDYEQSLNVFQSVSGATAQQMALVGEAARALGKDATLPGISAADAAVGMTELAKAGLDVKQTLDAAKPTLSLAKAGNIEVADAAKITAQALNAFSMEGKDASKVADMLSAGANASAADVLGLSQGLQQSAAVAHQFGLSLQDNVTVLSLFANRGMQGSDAGTSLKTMLIALASPSKQAAALMKEMGLQTYDAQGKFVGMQQFALNLQNSLKGLSEEQKQNALATIFGNDAFRAAAFLADDAGKKYDQMSQQVGKVGAATDLAAAQNKGFKGALDNMVSVLQTVGTDIGTKVLPPLTDFLRKLADSGIFDKFVNNIDTIMIALGTMGAMFLAFKITRFVQGFMEMRAAIMAATGTTSLFNAVLALNPIVLIVMAVIALIGVLVWLQVKFNIFGKLFKWIGDVGKATWQGIKDGFKAVGDFIGGIVSAIGGFFTGLWNGIVSVFNAIVNFIKQWGLTILAIIFWPVALIIGLFFKFKDQIFAVFNAVRDFIVGVFTAIWDGIVAIFTPVVSWFAGVFSAAWAGITAVWGAVTGWFGGVWQGIVGIFNGVAGWFGGIFQGAWNAITGVFGGMWNWFKTNVWDKIVGVFTSVGTTVANAIGGAFKGVLNTLLGGAVSIINGFIKGINWAIDTINNIPGVHIGKLTELSVPKLAFGANNYAGGATLVGERGPEMVQLPKGSNVYSATQTANALRNSNGGGGVTIEKLEVNNNVDVGLVVREIGWRLATQ